MVRWTRFYGGFILTKTSPALNVIRRGPGDGLYVRYYNVEKQYDPEFAEDKYRSRCARLDIVEGTTIEEIGEKTGGPVGVSTST